MANVLKKILNYSDKQYDSLLRRLEISTGRNAIDNALQGEVIEKSIIAIRELGLSEKYLTRAELLYSLYNRLEADDLKLQETLGIHPYDSVAVAFSKILYWISLINVDLNVFVIKKRVMIDLLSINPPKRLLRTFNESRIEDLIKKHDIYEVLLATRFSETDAWHKKYLKQLEDLTVSDFEVRSIKFVSLEAGIFSDLAKGFIKDKKHPVIHLKELGIIGLLENKNTVRPGETTLTACLTLNYINEIKLYTSYFVSLSKKRDFGLKFAKVILNDEATGFKLAGTNIHWRAVQKHYANLNLQLSLEDIDQIKYLSIADNYFKRPTVYLSEIEPSFIFWKNLSYVAKVINDQVISMNLMDVAFGYLLGRNEENYQARFVRDALYEELFSRYLVVKTIDDLIS